MSQPDMVSISHKIIYEISGQYVRGVYATAINFPCIITLLSSLKKNIYILVFLHSPVDCLRVSFINWWADGRGLGCLGVFLISPWTYNRPIACNLFNLIYHWFRSRPKTPSWDSGIPNLCFWTFEGGIINWLNLLPW